ncbi:MAG: hypothetical protein K2L01_07460 [Rikenellaceae bacterium]|nr:hypothetical protein [Rikenellaceae bacterium]
MKSERAIDYISEKSVPVTWMPTDEQAVYDFDAMMAVAMAEEDATAERVEQDKKSLEALYEIQRSLAEGDINTAQLLVSDMICGLEESVAG